MIKIIGNEKNVVFYECNCGTRGKCMFKPAAEDSALVIDVRCPNCFETERITVLQYSSDAGREELIEQINYADLSWSPTVNEEF